MTAKKRNGKFQPGDWAVWKAGDSRNVVQIIQNVGPAVRNGPNYYRFRTYYYGGDYEDSELPEISLEPARETEIPALSKS